MERCVRIEICPLFNDVFREKPDLARRYESRYCRGDYARCARMMALDILGAGHVPAHVMPDQHGKLRELIQSQ